MISKLAEEFFGSRKKAEKKAEEAGLTGEEKIKFVQEETLRGILTNITDEGQRAYEELVKYYRENKDKMERREREYLEAILESLSRAGEIGRGPDSEDYVPAIILAEAIKNGLHKDPEALTKYMITAYNQIQRKILETIPRAQDLTWEKHRELDDIINPVFTLLKLRRAIHFQLWTEKDPERKKQLEKLDEALGEAQDEIERRFEEVHRNPALLTSILRNKTREIYGKQLLEETLEEQKPLAPQLAAKILEERLPGAAYRLATLLHAYEQGTPINPRDLQAIIEATTAPHSPQGTQHYNLIYKIIDKLEEDIARGKTPRKPTEIIEEIIRETLHLKPYHNTQQILQEITQGRRPAEAILLKTRLGLPGDKKRIAKTILNLLRIAKEIEEGKRDPYHEDVKSELATIAQNLKAVEPTTPTREYLQKINPQTLQYLHDQIHKEYTEKAIQIGRETATQILEKAIQIAKEAMKKHQGKPYYQLVAETVREVEETLKASLGRQPTPEERQEARWAALATQHLLQTLPIHVAETREELGMAKHLLTQGYNPQEYDVPLILDTIGKMAQLGKYSEEERKGILELIRMGGQTAEVVKNVAWRTLQAHREEGKMEPREYIRNLTENIRSVSRVKR